MLNSSLSHVITGLENLCRNPVQKLKGKRLGLLANPASVDTNFRHASTVINQIYPGQLKALFSPQHGFYAEKQDNMVESDHAIDPVLQIPIFSLYSSTRIPEKKMFDLIEALIIDLQDVGTRVYTFIYTISYCLEAAAQYGKEVFILDRPNPVGGVAVEGNVLKTEYASFVGRFPIPMRHGLTVGEISTLFNSKFIGTTNFRVQDGSFNCKKSVTGSNCELTVIPMVGWKREMLFSDTHLPWIPPSPNLPTPSSALVYPGQVIWEGTNISEGRGTTQPFEIFGAPFLDNQKILDSLNDQVSDIEFATLSYKNENINNVHHTPASVPTTVPGAILRPVAFEPTSGKWCGEVCYGLQIHVIYPYLFKPYKTSLLLLQQILKHHLDDFRWKEPPYEYEYIKLPMDLILGDNELRKSIENFENLDYVESSWQQEIESFKKMSQEFYIYA